jgi:hypothetical protein
MFMTYSFLDQEQTTKAKPHEQSFSERSIFPIISAEALLSSIKRKELLASIKTAANIPEEHFDALYNELIHNFTNFVQILPVNNEARLGSLIDEALWRGLYALQLMQQQNAEEEGDDPLMNYVLFSASLMFDVGCVTEERTVIISDQQGNFIRQWEPHVGPMVKADGYYRIRRAGGMPPWLCRKTTALYARQLMPLIGFNWIAQDNNAFNTWLALLNYDKEGAGSLRVYFDTFDRAQKMLEDLKIQQDIYDELKAKAIEDKENELAEDFIGWVKENVKKGAFKVNAPGAPIHKTKTGTVIVADTYKKFAAVRNVNVQTLLKQLKNLGVTDGKTLNYVLTSKEKAPTGMFVKNNDKAAAPKAATPSSPLPKPVWHVQNVLQIGGNTAGIRFDHALPSIEVRSKWLAPPPQDPVKPAPVDTSLPKLIQDKYNVDARRDIKIATQMMSPRGK